MSGAIILPTLKGIGLIAQNGVHRQSHREHKFQLPARARGATVKWSRAVEGDSGLFALPPTITQPVTFATRICSRVGGGGTLTGQKATRQFDHDGTEKYKVQPRFHVGIWTVYWGCRQ